jgi:hypothetical protein
MKVSLYRVSSSSAARSNRSIPSDASYIRLGDEIVVFDKASPARSRLPVAAREGTVPGDYLGDLEEKNLHLVVQIGNRFEQDHPNVPIIVTKGRYLVVNIALTGCEFCKWPELIVGYEAM